MSKVWKMDFYKSLSLKGIEHIKIKFQLHAVVRIITIAETEEEDRVSNVYIHQFYTKYNIFFNF